MGKKSRFKQLRREDTTIGRLSPTEQTSEQKSKTKGVFNSRSKLLIAGAIGLVTVGSAVFISPKLRSAISLSVSSNNVGLVDGRAEAIESILDHMSRLGSTKQLADFYKDNHFRIRFPSKSKIIRAEYVPGTNAVDIAKRRLDSIMAVEKDFGRLGLLLTPSIVHELEHARIDFTVKNNVSGFSIEDEVLATWAGSRTILDILINYPEREIIYSPGGLTTAALFILPYDSSTLADILRSHIPYRNKFSIFDKDPQFSKFILSLVRGSSSDQKRYQHFRETVKNKEGFRNLQELYRVELSRMEKERKIWRKRLNDSDRKNDILAMIITDGYKNFAASTIQGRFGPWTRWQFTISEKIAKAYGFESDPSIRKVRNMSSKRVISYFLGHARKFEIQGEKSKSLYSIKLAKTLMANIGISEKEFQELLKAHDLNN